MVLPITTFHTTTAKAVTAAILKLDQALNRMEGVKDNMDKTSLPSLFSRVLELVVQNDKEVQLFVLTCRPLYQLENLMAEVFQLERWPLGLRIMKVLRPAVVLDKEEEQFNMDVERFTFTDWLDLNSYFREWLVHQSSDKFDLKVERSWVTSRLVGQMMDRVIVLSTVSQSVMSGPHDGTPCYPHL